MPRQWDAGEPRSLRSAALLRLCTRGGCLAKGCVRAARLVERVLGLRHPGSLLARDIVLAPAVDVDLPHPNPQHLGRAVARAGERTNRLPARRVSGLAPEAHAHRSLSIFPCVHLASHHRVVWDPERDEGAFSNPAWWRLGAAAQRFADASRPLAPIPGRHSAGRPRAPVVSLTGSTAFRLRVERSRELRPHAPFGAVA